MVLRNHCSADRNVSVLYRKIYSQTGTGIAAPVQLQTAPGAVL